MKLMGICLTVSALLKIYLAMDLNTQIEVISSVTKHYHSGCVFILTPSSRKFSEYDLNNLHFSEMSLCMCVYDSYR